MIRTISLGAGVQSSALLLLSDRQEHGLERADVAIFADTGCEPMAVYEWLDRLEAMVTIPIIRIQRGDLLKDMIKAAEEGSESHHLPYFIASPEGGASLLNRQCTAHYKISAVLIALRKFIGVAPRKRVKQTVEQWVGISTDEADRMKPAREKWIKTRWPLCFDIMWSRQRCKAYLMKVAGEVPPKSSCIICSYHSNAFWRTLRDYSPAEWAQAVWFDKAIRKGTIKGAKSPPYLHRSLLPLDEAPIDDTSGQLDLWTNECEGMCGV